MQEFSSKLLENTVFHLSKLPGIGKRTAVRLALHLLNQSVEDVDNLVNAISSMRHDIFFCKNCHSIAIVKNVKFVGNKTVTNNKYV